MMLLLQITQTLPFKLSKLATYVYISGIISSLSSGLSITEVLDDFKAAGLFPNSQKDLYDKHLPLIYQIIFRIWSGFGLFFQRGLLMIRMGNRLGGEKIEGIYFYFPLN